LRERAIHAECPRQHSGGTGESAINDQILHRLDITMHTDLMTERIDTAAVRAYLLSLQVSPGSRLWGD